MKLEEKIKKINITLAILSGLLIGDIVATFVMAYIYKVNDFKDSVIFTTREYAYYLYKIIQTYHTDAIGILLIIGISVFICKRVKHKATYN